MVSPSHESHVDADRRIAAALFLLTAAAYAFFFGGGGWNANAHFDLTRALVEDRSIRVDRFAGNTGDIAVVQGHAFVNKPPGASLLGVIPYAFAILVERASNIDLDDPLVQTLNAWFVTMFVCGLFGAVIPAVLYLHGRRQFDIPSGWAASIALLVALATPLFAYATVFFLHVPSAALILLAYVFMIDRSSPKPLVSGIFAGLSCATNYLALPLAGILLICGSVSAVPGTRRHAAVAFVAGSLPGVAVLALYQCFAFGGLLRIPIAMNRSFTTSGAALGILKADPAALFGITISPYRGLFYVSPVLVMALGGIVVLVRRRDWSELLMLVLSIGVFFAFNLSFNNWEAGFGIGARYLVPIIPLLGILMMHVAGVMRPMWIILGVISLAANFAAVAVDPLPSGTIPRPLTQYIFPLLLHGHFSKDVPITPPWSAQLITGHVAVSPHSIDQIVPYTLHPPRSAETQWAAFNLGEPIFGVGSLASLTPVLAWIFVGCVYLGLRLRWS